MAACSLQEACCVSGSRAALIWFGVSVAVASYDGKRSERTRIPKKRDRLLKFLFLNSGRGCGSRIFALRFQLEFSVSNSRLGGLLKAPLRVSDCQM